MVLFLVKGLIHQYGVANEVHLYRMQEFHNL